MTGELDQATGPDASLAAADAGPLAGLLVADFSRVVAGPYATMLLGDLGADVIKVERPGAGDDTRGFGPPFLDGESAYYLAVNRNKRGVAWDLGATEGRRKAQALAARADIVVENFRPGTAERFGIGYEDVVVSNPRVVYCSISGFGTTGAGAALPGYDFLVQGVGGLMSITGDPDGEPRKVGVAVVDVLTAQFALSAILAALYERERSGRGQLVEVNLLSALLSSLINQSATYLTTGRVPRAMGNRHPSIAPYETLRSADRLLVVAVGNDPQFATLARVVGAEWMASDRRWARNADRVENRDAMIAELEARLVERPASEWVSLLLSAAIPAGVVNDVGEAFALADALGLEPVVRIPRVETAGTAPSGAAADGAAEDGAAPGRAAAGRASADGAAPGRAAAGRASADGAAPGRAAAAARAGPAPHNVPAADAHVRHPVRYSRTPPSYRSAPPRQGEHTAEVEAELGVFDGGLGSM